MDPSSLRDGLLAMHFIAQSAPDIRHKIQKATTGTQTPMNDLIQLAHLVSNNQDMAEKAESIPKKYTRDPNDCNRFVCSKTTNLVLIDHKAHGYSYKASILLCRQKGTMGEGLWSMCPLQAARVLAEGMPRCQRLTGASQPLMVLQSD